jgi:hypothetical protein
MTAVDPTSGIPASLAPFFQEEPFFPEYDLSALDLERSAATIIERVLQYGNRAEIHSFFTLRPTPHLPPGKSRSLAQSVQSVPKIRCQS